MHLKCKCCDLNAPPQSMHKKKQKPKSLENQKFFDNCIFAQFLKLHEPKRNRNYLIVF